MPQPAGGRRLFPLPAPEEGVRGRTSALVMGRVRDAGEALQPPAAMNVVFLRDGLLASEADADRAKPLGVPEYLSPGVDSGRWNFEASKWGGRGHLKRAGVGGLLPVEVDRP